MTDRSHPVPPTYQPGSSVFDHLIAKRLVRSIDSLRSIDPLRSVTIPFRPSFAPLLRPISVAVMVVLSSMPAAAGPPDQSTDSTVTDSEEADGKDAVPAALAKWRKSGFPLMQTFCADCHNADVQEGGLDLTPFETLSDLSSTEVKRVLEMVRFGAMPPEGADAPKVEQRKLLVASLEETMYSSTCDLTPRAGNVTVRRLNRSEYNNTIRDLFGMDLRPADQFPSDEVGAGFDNNGDVLSLSPMLIEKYIQAAEEVSKRVVIDPVDLPKLNQEIPGDQIPIYGEPKIGRFGGRFIDRNSFAWIDVEAPFDGQYRIEVRGGTSTDERKRMKVAICDESGRVVAFDHLQYYGGGGSSDSMREDITLTKGTHRLALVAVDDDRELKVGETEFKSVVEMDSDRVKAILAARGKATSPDDRIDFDEFPFMFRSFRVDGPSDHPREAYPPKQFQIVRQVAPKRRDRYSDVTETAIKNLRPLMKTVFRGPVTDDEIRPYAELVKQATDDGQSFHRGTQIALSALLISPRFLFRVETPDPATELNGLGDVPLSQHQLATRLSYFIWSSTPDQTLIEQADRNEIDEDRLKSNVARILNDQRSDALASEFAAQWLGLRNLAQHEADSERFPVFDDELKSAMKRETELLFLHVLHNNLSVSEFLTADYSFLNQPLAKHYGVEMKGDGFQKVSLSQTPRRGLLSHASVLTLTSTPNRTSPVLRGKWILENVLGSTAPEAPAGVPNLDQRENADTNATLRQQLEVHRQDPTCASCHRVMDQLGFGLDDYDAIGRYRTEEGGQPIDASGALPDGRSFNGGADLSRMLAETELDGLARSLIEKMLTFAIGRELTPDDRCTIDEIVATTKSNQYRLGDIVTAVATSRPFRYQTLSTNPADR
ncbi:MAG: DUF1592 domain-containing protein [Planctomycetales bacterium]|nr:DUF1592 domain-containing protein [Planctomycetales bacterium]